MLGLEGHKRKCNSSGLIDSLLAGIARGKTQRASCHYQKASEQK